jgi:hypothetical protein
MELFICWISKVPDVIWSAVIASGLTFLGVLWTNKGSEKRQDTLLEHEKRKFQDEQKLVLKKEVFLNLASSFANVLEIIPKLSNLDFSQKEIEMQIKNHSGIVAKSYLVANESTVSEILNYSVEITESLIPLMLNRAIVLDHKMASYIYQSTIESSNNEKNRIITMMQEFNLQGRSDKKIFDYLTKSYEIQNDIVEKSTKSKEVEENILRPLLIEFTKKCIEKQARLISLSSPMIIALRKELGSDSEPEAFKKALNKNIERMNSIFDRLFIQEQ